MADRQDRKRKRSTRRMLFENLAKVAHPPHSTPQWKDALREQEMRGPKRPEDKRA